MTYRCLFARSFLLFFLNRSVAPLGFICDVFFLSYYVFSFWICALDSHIFRQFAWCNADTVSGASRLMSADAAE